MLSRKEFIHGVIALPLAGALKIPENIQVDEFEFPFVRPYIGLIADTPPHIADTPPHNDFPGILEITCCCKFMASKDMSIVERHTWRHLYIDKKQKQAGLDKYMDDEQQFAKKLYEAPLKTYFGTEAPEFRIGVNPMGLKRTKVNFFLLDEVTRRYVRSW